MALEAVGKVFFLGKSDSGKGCFCCFNKGKMLISFSKICYDYISNIPNSYIERYNL